MEKFGIQMIAASRRPNRKLKRAAIFTPGRCACFTVRDYGLLDFRKRDSLPRKCGSL